MICAIGAVNMREALHIDSTRRDVLRRIGAVGMAGLGGTALASSSVAAKPSVDWKPADASNYTGANRSAGDINWVIIHVVQGSASSAVNWFQNPDADVSAHYTVAKDGHRYQSVSDQNTAWHAGNSGYNQQSIGIEHGGYVSDSFTADQYQSSATLTSWLCEQYGVPKQHPADPATAGVIGHAQVPGSTHTDPGGNWNWGHYMDLVTSR